MESIQILTAHFEKDGRKCEIFMTLRFLVIGLISGDLNAITAVTRWGPYPWTPPKKFIVDKVTRCKNLRCGIHTNIDGAF